MMMKTYRYMIHARQYTHEDKMTNTSKDRYRLIAISDNGHLYRRLQDTQIQIPLDRLHR